MRSRSTLACAALFATATATAALVPAGSGCFATGESCSPVTACKFVDLLAACEQAAGCPHGGLVKVISGSDVQDPTTVQVMDFMTETTASLGPNSGITVPIMDDAATLAALPLLDITATFTSTGTDQLSVLVDGQPFTACVPRMTLSGTTSTAEWKCPLPAATQSVELVVLEATVSEASMVLTEPTCTGSRMMCAL